MNISKHCENMSIKNFKISANGNVAVDGNTFKFTGTIVVVNEETNIDEEINMPGLKIDDEAPESQEDSSLESPAKSVNLLEESSEDNMDSDNNENIVTGADSDDDTVTDMPATATGAITRSKILFHDGYDVEDDYGLSQTVSGYND